MSKSPFDTEQDSADRRRSQDASNWGCMAMFFAIVVTVMLAWMVDVRFDQLEARVSAVEGRK